MTGKVSKQALRRLPYYLDYLKAKQNGTITNISATIVANDLKLNEVQVRKDLAAISKTGGKPKTGYILNELVSDMEGFLGYNNTKEAVLIGAGKLGKALMSYKGFERYGLNIVAAFDTDESVIDDIKIFHMDRLTDLCQRLKIHIGIIATPACCAQKVCDTLIRCDILAIWNFAPAHLTVPENVILQNENMAASLAVLSKNLEYGIKEKVTKQTENN